MLTNIFCFDSYTTEISKIITGYARKALDTLMPDLNNFRSKVLKRYLNEHNNNNNNEIRIFVSSDEKHSIQGLLEEC